MAALIEHGPCGEVTCYRFETINLIRHASRVFVPFSMAVEAVEDRHEVAVDQESHQHAANDDDRPRLLRLSADLRRDRSRSNEEKVVLPNKFVPVGGDGAGYATETLQYADDLFADRAIEFVRSERSRSSSTGA